MSNLPLQFLEPAELAFGFVRSSRYELQWHVQFESENIRFGFMQVTEAGLAFLTVDRCHSHPNIATKQLKLELFICFSEMHSIKQEMDARMRIFVKDGPKQVVYFNQASDRLDFEHFVLENRLMVWSRRIFSHNPSSFTPSQAIYKLVPAEEE